jgi:alpha-beta hydrolase superfamily lysophospholipase
MQYQTYAKMADVLPTFDVPARTAVTSAATDGVLLRMDRYPRVGAAPVLLLHGWMQSPRGMDSPVVGRSVARHLSSKGFDVYVGAMRGHGDEGARSGSLGHWTPEDHAALDLPAMVRKIRRMTGRAPALVGHSLGGLVSLLYLAGAVRRGADTLIDALEAKRRNGGISAVVAIAPPLAFPKRSIGLLGERPDLAGKLLCKFGASRVGGRLLNRIPNVALHTGMKRVTEAPGVGRAVSAVMVRAAQSRHARGFWRPENMSDDLVATELFRTLDATSGAELHRLAGWVARGGLEDHWRDALGSISAPTLIMAGSKDGVSTVDGIIEGSQHVGAKDRRLMVVKDAGHNDLRVGDRAVSHVYPAITEWLSGRR